MEEDYKYYFHSAVPFKIGDKAAYNIGNSKIPIYKEVIIKSEPYIAPSGAQYYQINRKIGKNIEFLHPIYYI